MDLDDATGTQERFRAYAADLASVLGHADRVRPFEDYCIGLLSAEGRKSVEPLAAITAPERTAAQHTNLCSTLWRSVATAWRAARGPVWAQAATVPRQAATRSSWAGCRPHRSAQVR